MEALDILKENGQGFDAMRLKAFPFNDDVKAFIDAHEVVFVVEQNRDAQMRTLLMTELGASADKLKSILNFDGAPLTAVTVMEQIH